MDRWKDLNGSMDGPQWTSMDLNGSKDGPQWTSMDQWMDLSGPQWTSSVRNTPTWGGTPRSVDTGWDRRQLLRLANRSGTTVRCHVRKRRGTPPETPKLGENPRERRELRVLRPFIFVPFCDAAAPRGRLFPNKPHEAEQHEAFAFPSDALSPSLPTSRLLLTQPGGPGSTRRGAAVPQSWSCRPPPRPDRKESAL